MSTWRQQTVTSNDISRSRVDLTPVNRTLVCKDKTLTRLGQTGSSVLNISFTISIALCIKRGILRTDRYWRKRIRLSRTPSPKIFKDSDKIWY
jgi:hypothetical protein